MMLTHKPSGERNGRDRVALVTGAGRGLGRSLALAFASAGAQVAANDLTPVNLDETVRLIEAAGGRVRPYLFDIAKGLPARALVDQVVAQFGRLDVLVNNAGVRPIQPLTSMDEWDWQRTLDVNLSGPFLLMQAAVKPMQQQGGGIILNIASGEPRPALLHGQAAYFASKSALITLSQAAAQEFSTYNIRVYTICPAETPAPGIDARAVVDLAIALCDPASTHPNGQVFWLEKRDWAQEDAGS
jgi:NAD(P)-dependent dehydrogenase (short-subunit alcohol dehydrogenase family)